jgi:tRNA dimethylallyltransferase
VPPAALAPLIVICGPTATGKTSLAIRAAEHLHVAGVPAEVISADSRQVYRGLDIGTAKATPDERARVVHHGIDLVDPDGAFSIADFRAEALAVLRDLAERGGIGILAGGTGLWIRAVADGINTDALPADPVVRAAVEAELRDLGLTATAGRLERLAPRLAAAVDLRNPRRVARALEIATIAGDVERPAPTGYPAPVLRLLLDVEPGEHARRIATRARGQFDAGLMDEARALRARWDPALPCFSAIGYREAWALLDDECTRDEAIGLDARRNVLFAKRQRTWFRKEPGERIDATGSAWPSAATAIDVWRAGSRQG